MEDFPEAYINIGAIILQQGKKKEKGSHLKY